METNPNTIPELTPVKLDKDGNVNLEKISPQETEKYAALGKSLEPSDVNSILNYGSDAQNSMEKYSNDFLSSVRTYNSGEVGGLINELLSELNYIDISELEQSGFKSFISRIPFLKSLVVDVKKLFQKYDVVVNNIDKITNKIKAGRLNSIKDNSSLQTMFDSNVGYIHQMEELIIAGQLKYNELSLKLAEMEGRPADYQDYEIADLRDFISRLDKRLADMKIVRFIMLQSLAQIRVVQNNNTSIAEKAQSIVSTTIPVWKNQLTIAVALQRQKANVEMQKKISDTTNTILQKNAEMLKQNSIDVAKENEKTVVSLETLKITTASLISTLNEVKQIHEAGAQSRKVLDGELKTLEAELKKNVTRVS
ncbi:MULTISPECIES: toxic anion resistance protein [unclassified Pedobacter]|uniref:toxic anion resistance protein n=1 Tax=Pedobacter TaxID=84567 RepID=UPI000B4AF5DE|nr:MULTISPECIES: toxic anion resistance protein [unclassified Pedobacter]MCX2430859.1 toxic anion resistance protein [Pedobacter sp. GR22-10]MCX2583930.1 toxic anion resistance protein [Pedobacter sp. MR22-3]OWK69236.1 toxic anion resistance protein [Pedobacter sp. AJM]